MTAWVIISIILLYLHLQCRSLRKKTKVLEEFMGELILNSHSHKKQDEENCDKYDDCGQYEELYYNEDKY